MGGAIIKTTGIFTLHNHHIEVEEGEPFNIIPFGDIHRNAPLCAEDYWQMFLDKCRADKEKTLYLGMGDYDDLASASEREILGSKKLHESTTKNLHKWAEENVHNLTKEIGFMKGKLIGLLGGNHYWDFPCGINSDMMMAQDLDCKFLGVSSFIRLTIDIKGDSSKHSVDIWAHHGQGSGRTVGGSYNTVEKMRDAAEADIYIQGHDHRKGAVTAGSRLELSGRGEKMRLHYKKQWLVRSGSFLRGYADGEKSYVTDAMMPPSDLGVVKLILTTRRIQNDMDRQWHTDIHCLS